MKIAVIISKRSSKSQTQTAYSMVMFYTPLSKTVNKIVIIDYIL